MSRHKPYNWVGAVAVLLCLTVSSIADPDPPRALVPDPAVATVSHLPAKASAYGKYRHLLRRLHLPEDRMDFGRYNEYGFWTGNAWKRYKDLPPGFWVYLYPYWYIWRDGPPGARPGPGALAPVRGAGP